jgi:hypothetical protein
MVTAAPPTHIPSRGTVIVDTVTLFNLCAKVNDHFKDRSTAIKHYTEILPWLASNGFNVVIPEAVMLETGDLLRTGDRVESAFPQVASSDEHRHRYAFKNEQIAHFLMDALKGRYPNIHVEPSNGPPEVKAYLDEINRGMDIYRKGEPDRGRAIIMNARKHQPEHFGDLAIAHYVTHRKPGEKIFLLSDDLTFSQALAKKEKIVEVNTSGLLHDLVAQKLHTKLGLKAHVSPEDLLENCTVDFKKHRAAFDSGFGGTMNPVDRMNGHHGPMPMFAALKELANPTIHVNTGHGCDHQRGVGARSSALRSPDGGTGVSF